MQHFILTRLATGTPGEKWLKFRIKIFKEYCAPSIINQSCKSFTWLLAVHYKTPVWFINEIKKICPLAKFIYVTESAIFPNWEQIIGNEIHDKILLTTRFDSDDAIHRDFVKQVQQAAKTQNSNCIIDVIKGYKLDQKRRICYACKSESNHFISMLEFGTHKTVFCKPHPQLKNFYRRVVLNTDKPMWVEGINGTNIYNKFAKDAKSMILWEKAKMDFLIRPSAKLLNASGNGHLRSCNDNERKHVFIQIATYRDPELIPTIKDILGKAKYPERLIFGVCRQYSPADGFDNLDVLKKDKRFRIVDVHYSKVKGVGWARNMTQRLYMGEEYTLQIDSHMRFVQGWDVLLIDMINFLQQQGYAKPMLTTYVPAYEPGQKLDTGSPTAAIKMLPDRFTPEGILIFKSTIIPYWDQLVCPVPAYFFSGHFYFTLGKFCQEVPYDPEIYFLGEEISMAVRSFTNGYDLFYPHRTLTWHQYSRKNRPKQWDDDKVWYLKNNLSYNKLKKLLKIGNENNDHNFGQFGLGKLRSLKEYERYSGVDFSKKEIRNY